MADTLEDFLTKTRRDLASLPIDERERRLDVAAEQLARYMAVRLEQGLDEEAAAVEAIHQFETLHGSALHSNLSPIQAPGLLFSPAVTAALYCAVANKLVACILSFLLYLIAAPLLPSLSVLAAQGLLTLTPSLLLALLAAFILVRRDGLSRIISTLASPNTVEGGGARWTALNQTVIFLLSVVMLLMFRGSSSVTAGSLDISVLNQSPVLILCGLAVLLMMLASPFITGWIVARAAPKVGLLGVQIAAVTSSLFSFADQCPWIFGSQTDLSFLHRVVLFIFLLLGQALLVGLAVTGAYIGSHDAKPQR
jgi:hypothetical protein